MLKTRIAAALAAALILAACGEALIESPDAAQNPSTTPPEATTSTTVAVGTTVPDVVETTTPSISVTTAPDPTDSPSDESESVEVLVYLVGGPDLDPDDYDCSEVAPVVRTVKAPMLLTGAMEALLAGPTPDERAAGYDSWFSEEVGWELESAIISDGVARIDFSEDSPFINNASTSCGSFSFLAQLDMTATQFPTVDRAVYSIGGNPATFYEWLQRDVPEF